MVGQTHEVGYKNEKAPIRLGVPDKTKNHIATRLSVKVPPGERLRPSLRAGRRRQDFTLSAEPVEASKGSRVLCQPVRRTDEVGALADTIGARLREALRTGRRVGLL